MPSTKLESSYATHTFFKKMISKYGYDNNKRSNSDFYPPQSLVRFHHLKNPELMEPFP